MTGTVFHTNISRAFWCSESDARGAFFEPAQIALSAGAERSTVAWLDELLEGGLHLPESCDRPLTVLVSGPPGSGKTTLTMELCYRLAKNDNERNPDRLFTLYISTDQPVNQLIANAKSFGYGEADRYIVDFEPDEKIPSKFNQGTVAVWGRDRIQQEIESQKNLESVGTLSAIVDAALQGLTGALLKQATFVNSKPVIERLVKGGGRSGSVRDAINRYRPDIIVIDSLNIVVPDLRKEFFERFHAATTTGCRMVIFVMDAAIEGGQREIWEYASDVVIRLDATTVNDYYVRTIQIVKARYQSHVWGKHQLKIYKKPALPSSSDQDSVDLLRRYHPYRNEGGIFVYPSIHWYLSTYKRRGPKGQVSFAQTRPRLTGVLEEGLPEGRCTAFIGCRGGHKSHLGYMHLLHRTFMRQPDECEEAALIISLRDDEKMTLHTLEKICQTEFPHLSRRDLERDDRLEILYYHPGYITPEEFFHRMFISLHRLKKAGKRKLTVLFNSLDQLGSRFPLCAKQEIFIPGIIEAFSGEGATSIFIAVDEPGQPAEQYGLLPMADLILSFYPYRFSCHTYFQHLDATRQLTHETDEYRHRIDQWRQGFLSAQEGSIPEVEAIALQVVRFAGGQKAGAKGILELVDGADLGLYECAGLHFTKLDARFDQGIRLSPGCVSA